MSLVIGHKIKDDGVWKKFGDAEIKIARAGSNEHLRISEDIHKPYKKQIDRGTLPRVTQRALLLETVARALILDWKNVADPEGNEVPYSVEAAMQALEFVPDLADFVVDTASDVATFYDDEVKKTAKK